MVGPGNVEAAGILDDRAGKSYLFVGLDPGNGVYPYSCDRAQGPCTSRQLPDGTALTVEVDDLGHGVLHYVLNARRPDGIAIDVMEENYFEAGQPPSRRTDPHPQRPKPTLSTDELVDLARALTLYPKGYPAGPLQSPPVHQRPPSSSARPTG